MNYQPVTKATFREITGADGHLANLRPFTGSNVSAFIEGDVYTVMSYETVIAVCGLDGSRVWVAESFYSKTTSKIQSACREFLGKALDK